MHGGSAAQGLGDGGERGGNGERRRPQLKETLVNVSPYVRTKSASSPPFARLHMRGRRLTRPPCGCIASIGRRGRHVRVETSGKGHGRHVPLRCGKTLYQ